MKETKSAFHPFAPPNLVTAVTAVLLRALVCALAGLGFPWPAGAGEVCPPTDIESLATADPDAEPDQAREERCRKSADYQYAAGRQLNARQRYPEAAERLELALMLRPDHWPSQMEFLIALRGTGDLASARALLASLREDPRIPPGIQATLPARIESSLPVLAQTPNQLLRAFRIGLTGGHDSNLMAAPVIRNFDLTLNGQRIPVALADSNRPRSGIFWRLDAGVQASLNASDSERLWLGSFAAVLRHAPSNTDADYAATEARIENAPLQNGVYFQGSLLTAFNRNAFFYRQTALEAGYDRKTFQRGQLRLGLEIQQRRYPSAHALDGQYQGFLARYVNNRWRAELRLGQDLARANRAGGDQRRAALLLGHDFHTTHGHWHLGYEHESLHDREGYSPLLDNHRKRHTNKNTYRIEYAFPWRDVEFYAGAEFIRQNSTLPLFITRTNTFYSGLRSLF